MAMVLQHFILLFICLKTCAVDGKLKEPLFVNRGESFVVQCSTKNPGQESMKLYRAMKKEIDIVYYYYPTKSVQSKLDYEGRVKIEGEMQNLRITIVNATEEDCGFYWCIYTSMQAGKLVNTSSDATVLVMVEVGTERCPSDGGLTPKLMLGTMLASGTLLLLSLVFFIICLRRRLKKYFGRKGHSPHRSDSVYEDMRKNALAPRVHHSQ